MARQRLKGWWLQVGQAVALQSTMGALMRTGWRVTVAMERGGGGGTHHLPQVGLAWPPSTGQKQNRNCATLLCCGHAPSEPRASARVPPPSLEQSQANLGTMWAMAWQRLKGWWLQDKQRDRRAQWAPCYAQRVTEGDVRWGGVGAPQAALAPGINAAPATGERCWAGWPGGILGDGDGDAVAEAVALVAAREGGNGAAEQNSTTSCSPAATHRQGPSPPAPFMPQAHRLEAVTIPPLHIQAQQNPPQGRNQTPARAPQCECKAGWAWSGGGGKGRGWATGSEGWSAYKGMVRGCQRSSAATA